MFGLLGLPSLSLEERAAVLSTGMQSKLSGSCFYPYHIFHISPDICLLFHPIYPSVDQKGHTVYALSTVSTTELEMVPEVDVI